MEAHELTDEYGRRFRALDPIYNPRRSEPGRVPLRAANLPVVLVPVGVDEDALDACLAALDAGTPPAPAWLADDAQAGPRGTAIIEAWLARTPLQAAHTRRASPIGEAAHIDEAPRLRRRRRGDPGQRRAARARLVAAACGLPARDAAIATATPWSNAGEAASWPRIGEIVALGEEASRGPRLRAYRRSTGLPAAVGMRC